MSITLITNTQDGDFETGLIADSDGKSYGTNQITFEFFSDEKCQTPANISSAVITVQAKQSQNANYNDVPDGKDMDIAGSDAPLIFVGIANFIKVTKQNIIGANFMKIIIDKF